VLLIEHDMSLVMQIAQRIVVLISAADRRGHAGGNQGASGRDRGLSRKPGGRRCLICPSHPEPGFRYRRRLDLRPGRIGFCVIYNASGIVNFAQGVFVMLAA